MPPNKPVRRLVHHSRLAPGPQPQNWRHPELQSRPGPRIRAGRRPRLYPLPPCSRQGSSLSIPAPSPPSPLPSPPLSQTSGEPCTSSRSSECLTPHPRFRPPPRPSPPSPGVSIPNAPAAPSPSLGQPLTWAGRESRSRAAGGFHSPPLPRFPDLYMASPPPARPEKLLESWKSFRRAPRLHQKKPKTSPKPPRLPPPPSADSPGPWVLLPPSSDGAGERGPPPGGRPGPHDLRSARASSTQRRLRALVVLEGGAGEVPTTGLEGTWGSRVQLPERSPLPAPRSAHKPHSFQHPFPCRGSASVGPLPPAGNLTGFPCTPPPQSVSLSFVSGKGSGVGRQLPCPSAVYLEHLGASSTSVTGPEVERDGPDSVPDPPRGKSWSDRGRDTSRTSGGLAGPGGVHRRENPGCPPSNMLCDPKPGTFLFWASFPLAVNCDVKSFLASLPSLSLSVSLSPWSPCPLPVWSPPTDSRSHYQLLSARPPTADSLLSSEPSGGILFCSRC